MRDWTITPTRRRHSYLRHITVEYSYLLYEFRVHEFQRNSPNWSPSSVRMGVYTRGLRRGQGPTWIALRLMGYSVSYHVRILPPVHLRNWLVVEL